MLRELSVEEFIRETGSDSPAPGGGSIAALTGASAAALIEMVANLTIGKEGYEDVQDEIKEIQKKSSAYKEKLLGLIDEDANSFNQVIKGFRMPKETDEEKEVRKKAIQEGYKHASNVPFSIGETAYELLDLAERVVEIGNKNAITDGAVAAMSARNAVHGAFYNVKINIGSIKDEEFVKDKREKMEKYENSVDKREKEILEKVNL